MYVKRIALFCILLFGCSDNENSSYFEKAKELCRQRYCVTEISEFENDFLLSPIDIENVLLDIEGNIISGNTVLVKFKDNISLSNIQITLDEIGAKISAFIPDVNIFELKFEFNSAEEIEESISTLLASGIVELAEKNYVAKLESLDIESSNENGLWGFEIIRLTEAYHFIEQNGIIFHPVKIAILDNGFDLNHREFSGLDYESFDFGDIDNDVSVENLDSDDKGHGTATAGVIVAQNNGFGLSGIAFNANLIALKLFPDSNKFDNKTFLRNVVAGIIYAVKKDASVINMSFQVFVNPSDIGFLEIAVNYAYAHNVVMVASSGNTGIDATNHFPSAFSNVISVGATGYDEYGLENRTNWSGFSQNDDPDILTLAAPGKDLRLLGIDNSFAIGEGTSFAAPLVSGLAGLLKQIRPELNPDEIRKIIYESATEILVTYPDGVSHNWRRINVLAAVKKATHEMYLPNHGIGKNCVVSSDCDFDLFCISGICTETCFEEKDRDQDLGVSCDNCNLFSECPVGTTCKSFDQSFGRVPLRICL